MFRYSAAPNLLHGRVILVTGAGRGIGRGLALGLAAHQATVVLAGRTVSDLEQVYDEIVACGHPQPIIQPLDLALLDQTGAESIADALAEVFGCLHGLIHNAALLGKRTPIEHIDPASWMELMQVNVNAEFLLTRAVLPLLKRAPDSSIIFTSSGVGRRGRAYWGAYAVSKFAVEGMMQVLADELKNTSSVRVNSLNPGATRTRMRQNAYPAENPAALPPPETLLPAYLYLMGPDSIGVTGQALDAQRSNRARLQRIPGVSV